MTAPSYTQANPVSSMFACDTCKITMSGDDIRPELHKIWFDQHKSHSHHVVSAAHPPEAPTTTSRPSSAVASGIPGGTSSQQTEGASC